MTPLSVVTVSHNYFNMPLWVAQDTGLFAAEQLAVDLDHVEPIDEVVDRLKDGRAQVGCGVTEQVILDRERGGTLEIVAGNVNRLPFDLIAAPHITSLADLRGSVVGVSSLEAGSSSLVMRLLQAVGLAHPDDYQLRAVGPILARWERLQSGEIQAGLQGIPMNYVALDAGYHSLANPREQFPDFQFTTVNVDGVWARSNEDSVVRFLRALRRAHEWYFEHREEATDIAVSRTGVSREHALRAWDAYTAEEIFPRDAGPSDAAIQTLIDVSALIRALDQRSATGPGDYVNRRYLDAAAAPVG